MIFADAGVIFVDGHIQTPMPRVFDLPVGPDGLGEAGRRRRREAAEVVASRGLRLPIDRPLGLDPPEAGQVGPGGLVLEPVEVVREPRAPDFQSTRICVDGLRRRVCRRPVVEEETDLLEGGGVVGFEGPGRRRPRRR